MIQRLWMLLMLMLMLMQVVLLFITITLGGPSIETCRSSECMFPMRPISTTIKARRAAAHATETTTSMTRPSRRRRRMTTTHGIPATVEAIEGILLVGGAAIAATSSAEGVGHCAHIFVPFKV